MTGSGGRAANLGYATLANDLEFKFGPQAGQGGGELAAETAGIKPAGPAAGAGRYKMQVIEAVIVPLAKRGAILTRNELE